MAFSDSEPRDARGRWTSGGAKLAAGDDETVKLFFASGGAQTRRGGDPTWRANNPGAVPASDYAYGVGAIGTAGDLAVFPDTKTGFRAARWNLAQNFDHLSFLEATRQGRADREDRNRIWISADHRFPRLLGAAAYLPISNLTGKEFDRGLDLFASLDRGEPGTASWNPLERPIHNPDPKFRSLALNAAQDFAVRDPKYFPKNGVTHCNEATVAIADTFGVARGILGSETGEPFMANVQVENLETASRTPGTKWKKIPVTDAQAEANRGRFVVLGWYNPSPPFHGHTVTVYPKPNGDPLNPSVAQIGGVHKERGKMVGNGIMRFKNAFGPDKQGHVEAFVYGTD